MRRLSAALSLALVFAVSAASAEETTLTLRAEPPAAGRADPAEVRIVVERTNTSHHPVRIPVSLAPDRAEFDHAVQISRLDGRPIAPTDYARWLAGEGPTPVRNSRKHVLIPPGGSIRGEIVLSRLYRLTPGRYTVAVTGRAVDPQAPPVRSPAIVLDVP